MLDFFVASGLEAIAIGDDGGETAEDGGRAVAEEDNGEAGEGGDPEEGEEGRVVVELDVVTLAELFFDEGFFIFSGVTFPVVMTNFFGFFARGDVKAGEFEVEELEIVGGAGCEPEEEGEGGACPVDVETLCERRERLGCNRKLIKNRGNKGRTY